MRAYSSFKEIVKLVKKANSIGLVPTMGSLHDGHLSIIKKALTKDEIVIRINLDFEYLESWPLAPIFLVPEKSSNIIAQAETVVATGAAIHP